MDAATRQELDELKKLPSHEAADLILERYPLDSAMWGNAITLIEHLSWKVPDQVRLAEYYLSRLPHASDRGYSVFLNVMQLERLLAVIERNWPQNAADVLSVQDPDFSVRILGQMESQKVSKIFNLMDKEVSARLQKQFLQMKK